MLPNSIGNSALVVGFELGRNHLFMLKLVDCASFHFAYLLGWAYVWFCGCVFTFKLCKCHPPIDGMCPTAQGVLWSHEGPKTVIAGRLCCFSSRSVVHIISRPMKS